MNAITSFLRSLPPAADFLLPTPETYRIYLNVFQYFPLFTTLEWLTSWYPAGKTSTRTRLNIPGRLGWIIMELVGPLNLLRILYTHPNATSSSASSPLPLTNKLLASLYLIHYANRALVSPLTAPSVSPTHAFIVFCAAAFNWVNSVCLGGWLVGLDVPVTTGYDGYGLGRKTVELADPASPYIRGLMAAGVIVFFLGMAGNIYCERTLFQIRKDEVEKRASSSSSSTTTTSSSTQKATTPPANQNGNGNGNGTGNKYSKVYVIPPASGLFASILYPHYVCEWLEWFGFALAGVAIYPYSYQSSHITGTITPSTSSSTSTSSSPLLLAPWLAPFAVLATRLGLPVPVAPILFAVNTVSNLLPHARWGRKWYLERFGEEGVKGRGAVVPFCGWC